MDSSKKVLHYLAIFLVPLCYGTFYSVFKNLLDDFPVFWLCWIRMLIALIFLVPFVRSWKKVNLSYLLPSFLLGLVFFIGLLAQSYSLLLVSAGTAGFVAVSFIVLTPIFAWILLGSHITGKIALSILIVIVGYFFMFFNLTTHVFSFQLGEFLNFIGAIIIALQIVLFEKYAQKFDTMLISIMQFFWITIFMSITVWIQGDRVSFGTISLQNWAWIGYLGIFTTIVPFLCQFWGQKSIPSVATSIIISFEPIFATLFGFLLLGEEIGIDFAIGGSLIFLGVISSIFLNKNKKNPNELRI